MAVDTLVWDGDADGKLRLIDQTLLPGKFEFIDCPTPEDVWHAIKRLSVRGAPAIGVSAAYGVYIGIQGCGDLDRAAFDAKFAETAEYLAGSRPTAVNLVWALERMRGVLKENAQLDSAAMRQRLFEEARVIHEEDQEICRRLGAVGSEEVKSGHTMLTHCNAGGLATSDYGTALAVFYAAKEDGKEIHVYADETRPLLQGARLTAWELHREGIPVTLICDSMAASVMREGKIQSVFVGADRIAGNGDVANKIGTYPLAVMAREHGVPFYVVAPVSTFDLSLESGSEIPIEQRDPAEITAGFGEPTAPEGIQVYNPAFDVTPASLVTGIATEKGWIRPVSRDEVHRVVKS